MRHPRVAVTPSEDEPLHVERPIAPPALLFFGCMAGGYVAERIWPLPPLTDLGLARVVLHFSCMAAAFILGAWALAALRRANTPADAGSPTRSLVTGGPYRFSRNPLYVALMLTYAAFTLLMDSRWMSALLPVLFLLLHFGVVRREERYLERKFGNGYTAYTSRVRRWL